MGYYHYWGHLNYQEALAVFNRVVKADPNRADIIVGIGYVERRMGLLAEAAESLRRAYELDPLSWILVYDRGETAVLLRRYDEAEQHFRRAVALDPEWLRPYGFLAMLAVQRDGDLEAGRAILGEAVQAGAAADDDPFGPYAWLLIDRVSRDWETATNRIRNEGWDVVATQFFYLPSEFIIAEYQRYDGSLEDADRSYRLAEAHLLAELEERPEDERVHSTLGRVYAGLGDKTAAIEHGQMGVDLLPVEKEAYRGAFRLEELAMIHAVLGNVDEAIEILGRLTSEPSYLSSQLLRLDPTWDQIRDHPRFQALLDFYD